MHKLILFDIDGTLLMTGGAGKRSFDQVFVQLYGISEAWQDMSPDGRTDPSLITELFENHFGRKPRPEECRQVEAHYVRAMEEYLWDAPRFRLLPGVTDLLALLHERVPGRLGIATGNFAATAELKLRRAGLEGYFSFGGYGSDAYDRLKLTRMAADRGRQAIGRWVDPDEIYLIGDTVHDVRCGKNLGFVTIGVASGNVKRHELEAARPDFVFDDLSDIDEISNIIL